MHSLLNLLPRPIDENARVVYVAARCRSAHHPSWDPLSLYLPGLPLNKQVLLAGHTGVCNSFTNYPSGGVFPPAIVISAHWCSPCALRCAAHFVRRTPLKSTFSPQGATRCLIAPILTTLLSLSAILPRTISTEIPSSPALHRRITFMVFSSRRPQGQNFTRRARPRLAAMSGTLIFGTKDYRKQAAIRGAGKCPWKCRNLTKWLRRGRLEATFQRGHRGSGVTWSTQKVSDSGCSRFQGLAFTGRACSRPILSLGFASEVTGMQRWTRWE